MRRLSSLVLVAALAQAAHAEEPKIKYEKFELANGPFGGGYFNRWKRI